MTIVLNREARASPVSQVAGVLRHRRFRSSAAASAGFRVAEAPADRVDQRRRLARFRDVTVAAGAHRAHAFVGRSAPVSAMIGMFAVAGAAFSWRATSQPSMSGRPRVEHDEVGCPRGGQGERALAGRSRQDLTAGTREVRGIPIPRRLIVFDEQHSTRGAWGPLKTWQSDSAGTRCLRAPAPARR